MIRFEVGGLPVEIRVRRIAGLLLLLFAFCLVFDGFVGTFWVDMLVEISFGMLLELAFPTFQIVRVTRSAAADLREMRRLRAEREQGR